jgi:polyisoprenoid-binding protein YceI
VLAESKITLSISLSPAGSFQAVSQKLKGNVIKTGESVSADKITVSIESMKTGIDLRDEHTWKHMNSAKHPKATLSDVKGENGKATGTLEVNGIKKPLGITYKIVGSNVLANFTVKATEFGLKKVEYLGVGVNDLIAVEALLPYVAR